MRAPKRTQESTRADRPIAVRDDEHTIAPGGAQPAGTTRHELERPGNGSAWPDARPRGAAVVAVALVIGLVVAVSASLSWPTSVTADAAAPASDRATAPLGALTPQGQLWVKARVADAFRDAWILDDGTGRLLVDLGPHADHTVLQDLRRDAPTLWLIEPTRRGWRVVAVERDGAVTTLSRRSPRGGPPPPHDTAPPADRDWRDHLERLGYEVLEAPFWTGLHYEAIARNPFGDVVEVHFDVTGEVYKERHRFDPPGGPTR